MSDFQILDVESFGRELRLALQQEDALLRQTCTTQAIASGDTHYFPIITANSGLNTRSGDGEIAFDNPVHTRATVTLAFKAVKDQILLEDLQTSQVEPRMAVVASQKAKTNYEFDQTILTALDATTETYTLPGSAITFADTRALLAQLYGNYVPAGDEVYGLISPAAWGQMMGFEEASSFDYSATKTLVNAPQSMKWMGVNWIMHPNLSGVGTSAAKCFLYSKKCIGHALAKNSMGTDIEWDAGNKRWIIATHLYHGAVVIQNGGVIEFQHDDTAAQAA